MQTIIDAESQALEITNSLNAIAITDQETYNAAVEARTQAKDWTKKAGDFFDGLVKPAYAAYKNLLDTKKKVLEPVETHIASINKALVNWDYEQEKLRQAEQARLAAEAQKQAEEERLQQAMELEEAGADAASVASVLSAPVAFVPAPVAAPTYEKSKAVVYRDNWSAEVIDLYALVKEVAKDKSKIGLLQPNQTALNQMAKALKATMVLPGVRAVNNRVAATGRG
jgi:hypothetical protein